MWPEAGLSEEEIYEQYGMTPEEYEDYRRGMEEIYADKLQALLNYGKEIEEADVRRPQLPEVRLGANGPIAREQAVSKPNNANNFMDYSKWLTQDDVNDFKANRYLGDREMLSQAAENGQYYPIGGGPQYLQQPIMPDKTNGMYFRRKTVEDNAYPSGNYQQIPNYQTSVRNPDYIQRQMDADKQEMNVLNWMEAEDELRKLPRQVF